MNSDKSSFGDRIRNIASRFQNEKRLQIQATSRILGAAAELVESHDQLISEVTEIMVSDLNETSRPEVIHSTESLKQRFGSLRDAKQHFHLKARSWQALADKLNESQLMTQPASSHNPPMSYSHPPSETELIQRVEAIEIQVMLIRQDLDLLISKLTQE